MRPLLKIMLFMMLIFLSIFLTLTLTDVLTFEKIKDWIETAQNINPIYVILIVIALLYADLILSIPGLPIIILSGSLIGTTQTSIAAVIGFSLTGITGYFLSHKYGHKFLNWVIKNPEERNQAVSTFNNNGSVIILLSRAMPMLPEVCCCMAGMTKMPFLKFYLFWLVSIVPYSIVASLAGSLSSLDNPTPALVATIGIPVTLWLAWIFYHWKNKKSTGNLSK